jgi:anti-sigma-K factor RskA
VLGQDDAGRIATADGMAISQEPLGGSPTGQPTGAIVFKGAVVTD